MKLEKSDEARDANKIVIMEHPESLENELHFEMNCILCEALSFVEPWARRKNPERKRKEF
jgi:hypothetical protein